MTVMVTGGSGFTGTQVLQKLGQMGVDVVNFDLVPPSPFAEAALTDVRKRVKFARGNFLDLSRMIRVAQQHEVDKMIHMARYSTGPSSLHEPATVTLDVEGTLNVLELARLQDVSSLVFTSSRMVYGPKQYEPVDEDHPKNPHTPYGSQKLMCELLGLNYHDLYGLNFKATRFTTVYGRGGMMPNYVHLLVGNAIKGISTKLSSGADFATDFTDSRDAADGVLLALNAKKTSHRTFNICSGEVTHIRDIVNMVKKLVPGAVIELGSGYSSSEFDAFPAFQAKEKQSNSGPFSIERAHKELGYEPKYPLANGLRDYYEWRLSQESSTP